MLLLMTCKQFALVDCTARKPVLPDGVAQWTQEGERIIEGLDLRC